ncbi:hypothetical protein FPV67DRAFT_1604644 [Lyophyllum atratum]|nr:hypothetical protein FPV67DRAFT_1604644 [Lyophyllum atratum]
MSNTDPTRASASSASGPAPPAPVPPTPGPSTSAATNQTYYSNWQTSWSNAGAYPYSAAYQTSQPYSQPAFVPYQPQNYAPLYSPVPTPPIASRPRQKTPPPSSPSPPPPEAYRDWDKAIHTFLTRLGLTQAAAGFEADLLVLNPTWEQNNVPDALAELTTQISLIGKRNADHDSEMSFGANRPLEERKLDYVHLANGAPPRSQSTINKEISCFLARNRARNDASNRAEFKRQRLSDTDTEPPPSCARADAKPIDRDVQMKYDIAKNDEGPLSRTVHAVGEKDKTSITDKGKGKERTDGEGSSSKLHSDETAWTAERHPGLDERLRNIETHLAVRYVPFPPRTLLARLKFLEEHIIRLEKEYPPWAALHFNQPNRGVSVHYHRLGFPSSSYRSHPADDFDLAQQWPPPPRQTPIIVPPHMRDVAVKDVPLGTEEVSRPGDGKPRNTNSSLHRAVLARLEVKQAMNDLAGGGAG